MDVTSARNYLGAPVSRVDGGAKVSGAAKYAAEHDAPRLAHGYVVSSAIARGRLVSIDPDPALAIPGVLTVLTHRNRPRMANKDQAYQDDTAPEGSPFRPLYDDKIRYSGQPVALVVAEDFDTARHAATLVHVEYQTESHVTEFERQRQESYDDKQSAKARGDAGCLARRGRPH